MRAVFRALLTRHRSAPGLQLDGHRPPGAPCSSSEACLAGKCVATVCTAGQTRCLDAVTQGVCDASGTAFTPAPCPANRVCAGGSCQPVICAPGSATCTNATTVAVCNGVGTATTSVNCADSGRVCLGGACVTSGSGAIICVPGTFQRAGSEVQQCRPDGTAWAYVQSCTTTCSRGACASTACAPFGLSLAHAQLPADNSSTALVVSDVIQDIDGVVVPDGTLFTVAAGNNTGGIVSNDADPGSSGVQVASVNGKIDFTVKVGPV